MRLNEQNTPLQQKNGKRFDLLSWLRILKLPGQFASSNLWLEGPHNKGDERIPLRVCAVRKSIEAEALAQQKQRHKAQRAGTEAREVTLEYGAWIVVVTTLPEDEYPAGAILEWYRIRWQIELAFKRLKSLADVGHLPKKDAASCRSWLYGKLLISLLTDKMQRHAASLPPGADNGWMETRPKSHWREQELLLDAIKTAVAPCLPLEELLKHWPNIQRYLAGPSRKRMPRMQSLLN